MTSAERLASANFVANRLALAMMQPDVADAALPPREETEWVFGRDQMLTALDERGNWWSGCSVPMAACGAMLKRMDVNAPVACFLAPPHAAAIRIALDKLGPGQAIIAVVPDEADIRVILACENFSRDFAAHRLWLAAGPGWRSLLETVLTEQIGLAVPAQFLRLPSTEDALVQKLIQEATEVFSRITNRRSKQIGALSEQAVRLSRSTRKFCVMTPRRFQLWNDEGLILADCTPPGSTQIDTADPSSSSPLKLAATACECGALLAPNFARADLPNVLPAEIPWFTWVTNGRVPLVEPAGPFDQLLVSAAPIRTAAISAGWPADRVRIAGWPHKTFAPASGKRMLTVLADTMPIDTPADLEDFSSHRVLWETIVNELAKNPFALDCDPGQFLDSRMRRFDVGCEAFPFERFLSQLIIPAYQQSVVRLLLNARLPVALYGQGWKEIDQFQSVAAGEVHSQADVEKAVARAALLVDLWPWRTSHPLMRFGRPVLARQGRNLASFIQLARQMLQNNVAPPADASGPTISASLLCTLI